MNTSSIFENLTPELCSEYQVSSNPLIWVSIKGTKWLAYNCNHSILECFSYNDDSFLGHTFGRAYPYEPLASNLPQGTKIPSVFDWKKLLRSFNDNVYELSVKGYSGIDLKPIGFHISNIREITNYSVLYWTSTTEGEKQIAIHFDFLHNTFEFKTIRKNWAIATRLIAT